MNHVEERRQAVLELAAREALILPLQESGFWFHDDLRTNLYYAMHLYVAASNDYDLRSPIPTAQAKQIAEEMILRILQLQRDEPGDPMMGHWPLSLGEDPAKAKAHPLPVELVANLLILFRLKYADILTPVLMNALHVAIRNVYESQIYKVKQEHFHHHETKLFHMQLNLGVYCKDEEIIRSSLSHINTILIRLKDEGFQEYGILPWFWHWVQAAECAWEILGDRSERDTIEELLNWLWSFRADYYFKGTWIGPRSRGHRSDIPSDRNALFDYIQFGDFTLPDRIVRLEGAGLLEYQVSQKIQETALSREALERWRKVPRPPGQKNKPELHEYVYRTAYFASGGMMEYVEEFDNEQQRFQITLPLQSDGSANQIYFFHPGKGYKGGDPRHADSCGEILLHRDVAAIVFDIPDDLEDEIIGSLPFARWKTASNLWLGEKDDLYIIVHFLAPIISEIDHSGIRIHSRGHRNGVVIEILTKEQAKLMNIASLEDMECALKGRLPEMKHIKDGVSISYHALVGDQIHLAHKEGKVSRVVNGNQQSFDGIGDDVKV